MWGPSISAYGLMDGRMYLWLYQRMGRVRPSPVNLQRTSPLTESNNNAVEPSARFSKTEDEGAVEGLHAPLIGYVFPS